MDIGRHGSVLILQRLNDISVELGHPFKKNGYHRVYLYQVTRCNQVTTKVGSFSFVVIRKSSGFLLDHLSSDADCARIKQMVW